jgi:hypothetical protein
LVDLRYTAAAPVAITPTVSGSFVNGVWTGNIAVLQSASNLALRADDGAGHAGSSSPFQVSGLVAAPRITAQPQSLINAIGSTATFTVTASGYPLPAYQWFFNGARLANGTNAALTLANVQTTQAGNYHVVASNSQGSATSQVATLTLVPVPARFLPGSLTRTNGQFRFTLQGQVGSRLEIQATTNLVNWTSLVTLTNVTGTISFLDPATNFSRRFYRALQLP